jgi:excisionase family DNA binding protein
LWETTLPGSHSRATGPHGSQFEGEAAVPRPKPKVDRTAPKRPWTERGGPLLTIDEAADYLGITRSAMEKVLNRKEVPRIKIGRLVRVHKDHLDALIEKQLQQ